MNPNEEYAEEITAPKSKGMDTNRKIMLGLVIALVVVAGIMHGWRVAAVGTLENKLALVESQQAQARDQLIEQARELDARHAEETLRLFSTPFAWAVRREAMASNLDQVDQYFTDLVQLPGFEAAVLAQPDGKIMVASDRKQLAQPFASLYPAEYLAFSDIKILREANGRLRAVIPILGLNQQLGTLVLVYTPPVYSLK
jgi:hypothetical protein